ncbi:SUMO protein smt3 [Scheffersomyces spartinae]|uniref:SUMO protein smt3 n=1 Tax=Scheffersomyces spartinae TaxID=45513 RepID=A0A9P8AJF6_9ASCO|nr:SUMO protein smt3 [Scheffersomyces spartinae]KAG7194730.1 SUMO protein smt3 [Scheffersomyces spartinae]
MSEYEQQGETPKEQKETQAHINLKVSDGSAEIFFKIKRATPMKKLMEAFCKRQGKPMDTLRFLVDGTRISPENTPDDLQLEDGDVIEAHREQIGGSY